MGKKHDSRPTGRWTTLEELLLVCAVSRHGAGRWDAIASELQNCVAAQPIPSSLISPLNCRDVYDGLLQRYSAKIGGGAMEEGRMIPMLDELRRIRIEELRREVNRHDVTIASLESKIKRLEEGTERTLKDEPDPSARAPPAAAPDESAAVAAAAQSNDRCFDESNSVGQKPELETVSRDSSNDAVSSRRPSIKLEPDEPEDPNPVRHDWKPVQDHDSSSRDRDAIDSEGKEKETAEKEAAEGTRAGRLIGSGGLRDSKQNGGDVQSSPSLSRKKKRRRVSGEVNGEAEVLPAQKRLGVAKPPETLVELIRVVRAHRLSSAFERRLRSQESERYRTLIRQHMDLRIINSRLDKGVYSHNVQRFYRDLLLLFNNAIIFQKKNSSEHSAAIELRAIVLKQMKVNLRNPPSQSKASNPKQPVQLQPASGKGKPSSTKTKSLNGIKEIKKIRVDSSIKISKGKKEKSFDGNKNKSQNEMNGIKKIRAESSIGISEGKKEKSFDGNKNKSQNEMNGIKKIRAESSIGISEGKKEKSFDGKNKRNSRETGDECGNSELRSHDGPENIKMEERREDNNVNLKKKKGAVKFLRRLRLNSETDDDDEDGNNKKENDGDHNGGLEREEEGKKRERVVTRSTAIKPNTRRVSKRSVEENVGKRKGESREKDGGIGAARKRLRRREVG